MTNPLNVPGLSPDHPANRLPAETLHLGDNRFAAKLSFDERCQMLALKLSNMSIGAIAVAFGVNRRTVTHVYQPHSPRYQNVRKQLETMGRDAFLTRYIDEDLINRVKAAAETPEAQMSGNKYEQKESHSTTPNPRATKAAGISVHKGEGHGFTHRIEVVWVDNKEDYPDGWYAKLLDTNDVNSEEPVGDPSVSSHLTSQSALNYARAFLNENY